jgi:hypothetical protein
MILAFDFFIIYMQIYLMHTNLDEQLNEYWIWWWWRLLKKDYNEGDTKSYPTQKYRPAKDISKWVNTPVTPLGCSATAPVL